MGCLEFSWNRAWINLDLQSPNGLFNRLITAYDEPHRRYHSVQHLKECIAHFSDVLDLAFHPGEVEIALWFHDAIYDPRNKDNERRSAEWADQALHQAGATSEIQQRVHDLIIATCHQTLPSEPDQQLLTDIDLAILGSPPARFREYDQQIKSEYSWMPGFLYRMKRKNVLRGFLARKYIYSTNHFKKYYEQRARANLRAASS
ncbi:MAG: N-methyl-D-aspartate receptor NMDAR2C subunit [Nitrosomonas sp.]|nr:N-methyl-D-aspartate receptor NMDAR2C subunit [Nitrosomonas sp.]MDL1864475.1 N-methyl-D-aspartate receptor NMDAR2C subunit [Betaproteobacteria bacterium PRO5]